MTRRWLQETDFFLITGVSPNHIFFCEERKGKAPICETLGVTHFIDDRLEVLGYLKTVPHKFLFAGNEREIKRNILHLPQVIRVPSWAEATSVVVKTLR